MSRALRVTIVLGTRPQIIKSAPVYHALRKSGVECRVINTGQHYDYEMNREFFSELQLPDPALDLNVGAGPADEQVGAIVSGVGEAFRGSAPDVALVPGDTNSALAAGIGASKSGVPVAHLESGCRSNDLRMAEEVNRRVLDHSSQVLLCPTRNCVRNVKSEKVLAGKIANVGDTMYDSLLKFTPSLKSRAPRGLGLAEGEYAFMTLHRAETVDDRASLKSVIDGVGALGVPVAFSVHPRTRERMKSFGIAPGPSMTLLDPLPYLDTLAVAAKSRLVITDSGGLQKEAYWLGRPVLVTRESTEWGEIVEAGGAFLVGTSRSAIGRGYRQAARVRRGAFAASKRIFGTGGASEKVARVLRSFVDGAG